MKKNIMSNINADQKKEIIAKSSSVASSIRSLTSDDLFLIFCFEKIGLKKTCSLVSSFAKNLEVLLKLFD